MGVGGPRGSSTPRQNIAAECERVGRPAFVTGCIAMLEGRHVDPALVVALGGRPARWAIDGGEPGPAYWLRVWAARGLFYVWDDQALSALLSALSDEAWRVREMAAKVVARHSLDEVLPLLDRLRSDAVPRVRQAAERAIVRLTDAGP